jgi:hypothetical protein
MSDVVNLEDELAKMVQELNSDVANGVDIDNLASHVIIYPCKLGFGKSGQFEGVGIAAVQFPPDKNIFFLSPVFVSSDDDANTLST